MKIIIPDSKVIQNRSFSITTMHNLNLGSREYTEIECHKVNQVERGTQVLISLVISHHDYIINLFKTLPNFVISIQIITKYFNNIIIKVIVVRVLHGMFR